MAAVAVMQVADVSRRFVAVTTLLGLALGVLGSLFFLYDLLEEKMGHLRAALRTIVDALIGASVLALVTELIDLPFQLVFQVVPAQLVQASVILFAGWGAALGVFNSLFAEEPDPGKAPPVYSSRDALVGLPVVLVASGLASAIFLLVVHVPASTAFRSEIVRSTLGAAALGGAIAGFWRRINWDRTDANGSHRLFSLRGAFLGLAAGILFVVAVQVGASAFAAVLPGTFGRVLQLTSVSVVLALLSGASGGFITGGITRSLRQWADSRTKEHLQAVGIVFILLAFVAQAVDPILTILNVAVK
jgi:hypothetical protein